MPLLAVFDVPRSIAFYRNALGFEVANTSKPFTDAKARGLELIHITAYVRKFVGRTRTNRSHFPDADLRRPGQQL